MLSGCMSSPTYGTGKSANQQLVEDVTGILSIGPRERGPEIAYNPRPGLVKPASLEVLPEPQQDMASSENPQWPESPEERRARIRADATANQDNPFYRPEVAPSGTGSTQTASYDPERWASEPVTRNPNARSEVQRRLREQNQGSPTTRRYLSEPPVTYRQPAATAAAGDIGEDEAVKERRAQRASGKSSWRDFIPGL
ncbi:hypothetical protein FY036_12980 [Mesorhizobium microcysteis]|uniref:Uncharacterized protein n=1 Tax=Neoaquamicrobium microcysteis TaxID=2682781 RepID=A0A5D4GVS7_9HYPH|nr:hypothetical protein FY036_12980 [Mesorhizobium microcysteis]